ncbi:MAG: site-specific integrase [Chloroflexia bacterium]|nr:site-specific integrase [Chloroflexia bacterium]
MDSDTARRPSSPTGEDSESAPTPPRLSRFRGLEGVTEEDRRRPPVDDPALLDLERAASSALPDQLPLFGKTGDGAFTTPVGGVQPLQASSSLDLARTWYRRELELARRPRNTIDAYSFDLQILENLIGPKPLNRIDRQDIARLLGEASNRTTRKRRLTSVRGFFRYLITEAKVLRIDPTEGYYPHAIQLRSPVPLFADEQEAMLTAAIADEPWSATAVWLMMRLGLARSELLALRRDHIDRTSSDTPVVFIFYDDVTKQSKERKLAATSEFATLYDRFLDERNPEDILFPVGPQAVNGMVERVRRAAEITKDV